MDVKHFLSKKLMNVGICDYTTIPFCCQLLIYLKIKKKKKTLLRSMWHVQGWCIVILASTS
jgi:hypothetical protein